MSRMGNPQIPSFVKGHHTTYIIPAIFSLQDHPNRGTTPEDDNQAIGMGKEDLERLTGADSCKHRSVQQAPPKFPVEISISS